MATTGYVDGKVTNMATTSYVDGKVTDMATQTWVSTQINNSVTDIWYYGSTAPDNGKTGDAAKKARKLLWIDSDTTSGGLKFYKNATDKWVHVPVAWQ